MWADMADSEDLHACVKVLIEAGASLLAKDSEGLTPSDYVTDEMREEGLKNFGL